MAIRLSTPLTNNSAQGKDSRYTQGGVVDRYPKRLGWWERRPLELDDTDISTSIRASETQRPDLVAFRIYGKANLMWLVLQYNNIVDIQTEFVTGVVLRLPSQQRVSLEILNRATGGNPVT